MESLAKTTHSPATSAASPPTPTISERFSAAIAPRWEILFTGRVLICCSRRNSDVYIAFPSTALRARRIRLIWQWEFCSEDEQGKSHSRALRSAYHACTYGWHILCPGGPEH